MTNSKITFWSVCTKYVEVTIFMSIYFTELHSWLNYVSSGAGYTRRRLALELRFSCPEYVNSVRSL